MNLKAEIRDLFRTLNESPAACAVGALLGIGGADGTPSFQSVSASRFPVSGGYNTHVPTWRVESGATIVRVRYQHHLQRGSRSGWRN